MEKQPPAKRSRKAASKQAPLSTPPLSTLIEEYPCLLDISSEPLDDKIKCSDSDEGSDSDDESICDSINGSLVDRLSIQEHTEDDQVNINMDLPEDVTRPHVSFEAVLQFLVAPPDLYLGESSITRVLSESSQSTDEAIMREALVLQTSQLSKNSKSQYKTHLRKFVKFCRDLVIMDKRGRMHHYDVTEVKVLRFLKEVMFKSTTRKYFHMNQSRDVWMPFMFKSTNTKDHIPTLGEVLQNIEPDKKGRRALDVPCGHQTMENVLKALCYAQERQSKCPVRPNSEANIRRSNLISNAMEKYSSDLVMGVIVNHKDLSTECEI
ncbi:MAG: hypothetical protein BYD32DRAFT_458726 [Podila humilis]|nr:MAG: hypothetical protein BYD32DRAFT_458726 [Podila humilis]